MQILADTRSAILRAATSPHAVRRGKAGEYFIVRGGKVTPGGEDSVSAHLQPVVESGYSSAIPVRVDTKNNQAIKWYMGSWPSAGERAVVRPWSCCATVTDASLARCPAAVLAQKAGCESLSSIYPITPANQTEIVWLVRAGIDASGGGRRSFRRPMAVLACGPGSRRRRSIWSC